MNLDRIRNLSIVAHVDHGKSTLSDRILELTGAVDARDMREQYLDSMDIERERGITIKAQNVRVRWKDYTIHLIDTPGHVDFGYEVSRSLAACEGVVLLVDAAQGIEAQTLANAYQALEHDKEIVAALNKIDLPAADPDRYADEIERVLGRAGRPDPAAVGQDRRRRGELLDAVCERIPPPTGDPDAPLQGLIFDSYYDQYRGVISAVRVVNGTLVSGPAFGSCRPVGPTTSRRSGCAPRSTSRCRPRTGRGRLPHRRYQGRRRGPQRRDGHRRRPSGAAAAGGLPGSQADGVLRALPHRRRRLLRPAGGPREAPPQRRLHHLRARDSGALGFGFRCGFLGLLHMDIVRERLEREFDLSLIATAPSVEYRAHLTDGSFVEVHNPSEMPNPRSWSASRSRISRPPSSPRPSTPAPSWSSARAAGATWSAWNTCPPSASSSSTGSRWRRW